MMTFSLDLPPTKWSPRFDRRLCRRNPILGKASEGAVALEARL